MSRETRIASTSLSSGFDRKCRLLPLFVCTVEDTIVRWKNVTPSEIFTSEKTDGIRRKKNVRRRKRKIEKRRERHIAKAARKRGRKKNSEKNSTSESGKREKGEKENDEMKRMQT